MRIYQPCIVVCLSLLSLKGEVLDVVLYDNPPLITLEEGREPAGIIPELMRSLELGRSDLEFRFREETFPEALKLLRSGEVDILPGIASSYERQQVMKFSKTSIMRNRAVIFRRENIPVLEMEDLDGKIVALLRDDVHAAAFRNLAEIYGVYCEVVEVDEYQSAVRLLREGEVDLAVINEVFASRIKDEDSLVSTFISFNPIEIRIGYRADMSPEIIRRIDVTIEQQHDDPESPLNRAVFRYLSPDTTIRIPVLLWVILSLTLFIAAIVVGFNLVLRKIVMQRTKELVFERDRAAAADRAKAHFLGNVSHEIRTPLNGILGFCQLLESSLDLSKEDGESVEAIIESGHRLEAVLSAILRYSSLVSNAPTAENEDLPLDSIFYEVVEILSVKHVKGRDRIHMDIEGISGHSYKTDRDAWYITLESLITNALKYGNDLPINVFATEIISEKKDQVVIRVEIEDRGHGIPNEALERVFLPFEQVDVSLSRQYEGIGLGLSLVKSNVEILGGTVHLESPAEGGLRAVVEVPISVSHSEPTP